MSHAYLFWHIATVAPKSGGFPPPADHKLVAAAGIQCSDAIVDKNELPTIWGGTTDDTAKLITRIEEACLDVLSYDPRTIVMFTGASYVLPTVVANALASNTQAGYVFRLRDECQSSIVDLNHLLGGDRTNSFDDMTELCGLPDRIPLDVAAAWHDKQRKRIGTRLVCDVTLMALAFTHMQYIAGRWNEVYTRAFRSLVRKAAITKCPSLQKLFKEGDDA